MTYKSLLKRLSAMSDDDLERDVQIYDAGNDNFMAGITFADDSCYDDYGGFAGTIPANDGLMRGACLIVS